ncbi:MAG: hypothetical protein ACTHV2_10355 [Brachybacterium sp.]|uniref:hypothetical protein n=1 Tax=Brachybacterium sp. TaxID=1891286 RepID=UPI003F8FB66F
MTANAIAPATRSSIRLVDRYFPRDKRQEALHITAEPNARHEADQCRFRDGEDSSNGRRAAAAATHRCEESEMLARSVTLDQVERYYDGEPVPYGEWGQFGVKAVLDEGESVMLAWGILLDEIEGLYLAGSDPRDRRDPLAGLRFVRYVDDEFGTQMVRIEEDWDSDGAPVTYRVLEMRIYR